VVKSWRTSGRPAMSRIGRLPNPGSAECRRFDRRPGHHRQGPQGLAQPRPPPGHARHDGGFDARRGATQRSQVPQAAPRPDPNARRQHGDRRDGRLPQALEITGVGYRATKVGDKLQLNLGYSHPIEIEPPAGIVFEVESPVRLAVVGIDKELVGQIAAKFEPLASRSPTRARACTTSASRSAARPARPARSAARSEPAMTKGSAR
jgi:hypothetical protein